MSRIVVDCEFVDLPWKGPKTPLWVGLACEDGTSWSGVNADVDRGSVSGWTAQHVLPLIPSDEPHLSVSELAAGIREFCTGVSEWWAWCPTVDDLKRGFDLGSHTAEGYHRAYWDWDLQLIRNVVTPWPEAWPVVLGDLHQLAVDRGVGLHPNERPHHPRFDAEWGLGILRRAS